MEEKVNLKNRGASHTLAYLSIAIRIILVNSTCNIVIFTLGQENKVGFDSKM